MTDVTDVLALKRSNKRALSRAELFARMEDGLPVSALEHLSRQIAPQDPGFKFRLVPRATLARRQNAAPARLRTDESDRLVRLAALWAQALEIWRDDRKAREFLFRPHPLLEGRVPIDMIISSEVGASFVRDILGGLQYGTAV